MTRQISAVRGPRERGEDPEDGHFVILFTMFDCVMPLLHYHELRHTRILETESYSPLVYNTISNLED